MSVLDNYTEYNRLIIGGGLSINSTICTEYTLSKQLMKRLQLEEINETTRFKNKALALLQKKIENGSMKFLLKIQGYVDRGYSAFDIIEVVHYRSGGAVVE